MKRQNVTLIFNFLPKKFLSPFHALAAGDHSDISVPRQLRIGFSVQTLRFHQLEFLCFYQIL